MVDVPCLDHLWNGQKQHQNNEKDIWWIGSSIACIACLYKPHDSLTTLGSPIGALVGLLLDQQRDPTSSPHAQHESSYNLLNQWDPWEKSLLPQLFRKATVSKIIYFLWIQSEYNLSCMLSKHREFLKILQLIQKLLIL